MAFNTGSLCLFQEGCPRLNQYCLSSASQGVQSGSGLHCFHSQAMLGFHTLKLMPIFSALLLLRGSGGSFVSEPPQYHLDLLCRYAPFKSLGMQPLTQEGSPVLLAPSWHAGTMILGCFDNCWRRSLEVHMKTGKWQYGMTKTSTHNPYRVPMLL